MNHNPIPTDRLALRLLKTVALSDVLDAIGHPDLYATECFTHITFGDATNTLCEPIRMFDMIDEWLSSGGWLDGECSTYTDEQSDRLSDFFTDLSQLDILIDLEN